MQDRDQDADQDQRRRYTVPDAAAQLGLTQDAVRKRIKRHTIEHERDQDGRVYVYLDTAKTEQDDDQDDVPTHERNALIYQMEARIDDLREALEAERRANDENRRIIAGLTQRIPAIEPAEGSEEAQESHEDASEGPTTTEPAEGHITQDTPRRRWWRFW